MLTRSPLVAAYLADLDRALAGAEPADRLEIVDSVAEHIDAALEDLGASPTQAQIAGVLRRLGTADDVAAAWADAADRPLRRVDDPATARLPGVDPAVGGASVGRTAMPPWAVAVLVVVGVAVLGPALLMGALPLVLVGFRAGPAAGFVVLGVLLVGTIALAVAWRRATAHRRAWLAGFVVALVLLLAVAVPAISLVAWSAEQTVQTGPEQAPTPMP